MWSSAPKFDSNKCKVHLKMLINRFKLLEAKKANLNKQAHRAVATLLSNGKPDSARIQVEHIIREDFVIEAYEILRQHAELMLARYNVVVSEAEPRREIQESLCTLIYAGWLLGAEVSELKVLLDQLQLKYGKPFVDEVTRNAQKYINPKVLHKLNYDLPDPRLVETYLGEIAHAHRVDWTPTKPTMSVDGPVEGTPAVGGNVPKPVTVEDLAGADGKPPPVTAPPATGDSAPPGRPGKDQPSAPVIPPEVHFPGMDLTTSWVAPVAAGHAPEQNQAGSEHASAPKAMPPATDQRPGQGTQGDDHPPPPYQAPYPSAFGAAPSEQKGALGDASDVDPPDLSATKPSAPLLPSGAGTGAQGDALDPDEHIGDSLGVTPTSGDGDGSALDAGPDATPSVAAPPAAADDKDDEFLRRLASLKS